jgi:CBS domain-containing protein
MRVSDILSAKGQKVRTVSPDEIAINAANRLRIENVGALVVSRDGLTVDGLLSERDIVNGLAEHGAALPQMQVSHLMTRAVVTCSPEDSIAGISRVMTRRRVRHLPVLQDGRLAGIVSIGDVVKHRLDEVEMETNVLRDYAIARG